MLTLQEMKTKFDKSNYEAERPLPTGKTTKLIELIKDELGGRILKEFLALRPNIYSYLTDDSCVDKTAKDTEKCVIKRELKIDDSKTFLENNKTALKTHKKFRSEAHNVFAGKMKKITLSANDGKRIQTSLSQA